METEHIVSRLSDAEIAAEVWKPVVGFERCYSVSNLGRVRIERQKRGLARGRIIRGKPNAYGYITFGSSIDGIRRRLRVHCLVAEAFIGVAPSPRHEVNHIDCIRSNNRVSNLEWVTRAQNLDHSRRLGRLHVLPALHGSSNPRAKLTPKEVDEIRGMKGVVGARLLAVRYSVSRATIQWIHQGKTWNRSSV